MQKQLWVYLTAEDEAELVSLLAAEQGVKVLRGRWFQGDVATLARTPQTLATRDLTAREHWTQLLHPTATQKLVTHPVEDGPLAGFTRLDEVRSEVMTIVRPDPEPQGLAPSRIVANTHAWFGGDRQKKSHAFSKWVTSVLTLVDSRFESTSFDWLRVAPHAKAWAQAGGKLHYLYRQVGLEAPDRGPLTPHRRSIG